MKQSISRRDFLKKSTVISISVTPVIKPMSQLLGMPDPEVKKLIDFGFRLVNPKNLLNLEFYFVNVSFKDGCIFSKPKLLSIYGQAQSFMIVRLPQQHIAEQSYNTSASTPGCGCEFDDSAAPEPRWLAKLAIAGFSYIVFRLMPEPESGKLKIRLNEDELMDWNNEQKFRLVIRQNLNESLFNIKIEDRVGNKFYENTYPLGFRFVDGKYCYDADRFPKAYGSPLTAIEAPWRLLVSPALADPRQYRFRWIFTRKPTPDQPTVELWIATLTTEPRPVILPPNGVTGDDHRRATPADDQFFSNMNLMFIGSPDHPHSFTSADTYFETSATAGAKVTIRPYAEDRYALVQLFIRYKLLALTSDITFSQLGAGAYFDFKNGKIEQTNNSDYRPKPIHLYSYKHLFSFGRDEGVEETELLLDKESGLKFLLIETTKRRTKGGESYLDYREYIKPLELTKDYTNHEDENGLTKFRSPFKKIRLLEKDPKRICSLDSTTYTSANSNLQSPAGATRLQGIFWPQVPKPGCKSEDLTFLAEITDWHGNTTIIHKKIQAITAGANDRLTANPPTLTMDDITKLFDFDSAHKELSTKEIDQLTKDIDAGFSVLVNDIRTYSETQAVGSHTFFDQTVGQLLELKNLIPSNKLVETVINRKHTLINLLVSRETDFTRAIQQKIDNLQLNISDFISGFQAQLSIINKSVTEKTTEITNKLADRATEIRQLSGNLQDRADALSARIGNLGRIRNDLIAIKKKIDQNTKEIKKAEDALDVLLQQQQPNQATVQQLKNLIPDLTSQKTTLKNTLKDILSGYQIYLQNESLDGIASLSQLLKNIQLKINDLAKLREDLSNQINNIKSQVEANYESILRGLNRQLDDFKSKANALKNQIDDNTQRILLKVKAASLLSVTTDVEAWFRTLTQKITEAGGILSNLLLGNIADFFSEEADSYIDDINVLIVGLREKIQPVPIIDVDGNPVFNSAHLPVTLDLKIIFADYFDGLISAVKLAFYDFSFSYIRKLRSFDVSLQKAIEGFKTRLNDEVLAKITVLRSNEKLVKNAIYTYRSKIGYAVNQLKDDLGGINGELSSLETDYFVLKGELKTLADNSIDFFHQYAGLPQLQHAQVYIAAVSKLVSKETPVAINYAQDYLNGQKDVFYLDIEKNATRVFAELKEYSKDKIKGELRALSEDLGGAVNPEIAVDFLSYLRDPSKIEQQLIDHLPEEVKQNLKRAQTLVNDLKKQIDATKAQISKAAEQGEQQLQQIQDRLKSQLADYKNAVNSMPIVQDLVLIGKEAKSYYDEAKSFSPDAFFKNLEAKLFGTVYLKDILGIDFQLPRLSPSRDQITYNLITDKIKSKDFSFFRFDAGAETHFQIYFSKSLKSADYSSFTRLSNFRFVIRLASEDVLLVKFKEFRVSSDNANSRQVSVLLDGVAFGGPLDFFGKLAEKLQLPGSGLRIRPAFDRLEVGYGIPLPNISAPGFNFANVKFDLNLVVPYATSTAVQSLVLEAGVNSEIDQFLLSVGIFGGAGYFTMRANPDSIIGIKAGVAFGGYFGINLGIASGYVFLFAGIKLAYEKSGNLTLVGYLICEGGVTVFGFISIYLTVMLSMTYQRIQGVAALYGSASLRYSIKIGFFKKSFEISFSKTFVGAKGTTIAQSENSASLYHQAESVYYAAAEDDPSMFTKHEKNYLSDATLNKDPSQEYNALFEHIYNKNDWEVYCQSFKID